MKKNHIFTNDDASCQKKGYYKKKAETLFSKMRIKYNETNFVYFDESNIDLKNINDDVQQKNLLVTSKN